MKKAAGGKSTVPSRQPTRHSGFPRGIESVGQEKDEPLASVQRLWSPEWIIAHRAQSG